MKKTRKTLRQLWHSFYMPTLLAIICFIVVVIVMLNTCLFRSCYQPLENDVYLMAKKQADYQAETLSALLNEFANLSAKIVNDYQLSYMAYSRDHTSAYSALTNYDLSFYKYDDLIIYYPGEEYLLTIEGTCKVEVSFADVPDPSGMLRSLEEIRTPSVLSTLSYGTDMSRSGLLFVYPYGNRCIVLFLLRYGTINSMLNFDASEDGSRYVIMDGDGNLLFANCDMDEGMLRALVNASALDGAPQTILLQGVSYLFSSTNLPYNLRMFTLNPIIDQFDELNRITNQNVICCIALVLLGLMVLLISFVCSYMPVAGLAQSAKKLVDPDNSRWPDRDIDALRQVFLEYGELSKAYDRKSQMFTTEQMKNMFILRAINGRYSSNETSANICEHLGLSFVFPYYCACVLLFDGENPAGDCAFSDVLGDGFSVYFCQTENRSSAIGIINCAQPGRLKEIGEEIMRRCLKEWGGHAPTVSVGHAYEALEYIPVSYSEARMAMDYRLMFGLRTVILYDITALHQPKAGEYPRKELNAFALSLLNWDVEEIQSQLAAFVVQIKSGRLSLQQVKCVCMELSTSFMREVNNINRAKRVEMEYFDVFHICEYNSIDELVQHITELSASIKRYLESGEALCQDNDIHRCLTTLDANLENSQFLLESLYDGFSITPQTLRRRFKKATGKTMNEYLTSIRLSKAKELLKTTSLELTDICRQCGYADQSTFIRAFKDKEGITPGKYREVHLGGHRREHSEAAT